MLKTYPIFKCLYKLGNADLKNAEMSAACFTA